MNTARAFTTIALALAYMAVPASADPAEGVRGPRAIGAPAGSGPYPAIAQDRADAPLYTVYRPQRLPRRPLPLILWGNGGCADNGLSASHFLREVASHGYLVIANGRPRREAALDTGTPRRGTPPGPASPPSPPAPRAGADETSVENLLGAIDWARAANADLRSDLFGRVALSQVAVMGHSCGGLQALAAGADPRISTVVAFDSGVYARPGGGLSGVNVTKADLARLHTPIAYVLGGPTDIAYPNGMDDFRLIDHVPVLVANQPVGHGGTFRSPNGGDWARFAVAWLDWQLKGDRKAGAWFVGKNCRLCTQRKWTIERKHFPANP